MPTIIFLPQKDLCPRGMVVNANQGEIILNIALHNNIKIEHACEKSCACTTCHCIIRKGFSSLEASGEREDEILDKAWGLELESRLSCQTKVASEDLVIEIPQYTINYAREY
ncbi:ISC system 2Fe-2S type ferredoxin [Candidatus Gillettellia adelgis]